MKVRILPFLTTFAQLSARLKNVLGGWLLGLGIKEGLAECATVCVKSVVILLIKYHCFCQAHKNVPMIMIQKMISRTVFFYFIPI